MEKWVKILLRSAPEVLDLLCPVLVEATGRGLEEGGDTLVAYCLAGKEAERCLQMVRAYCDYLRRLHPSLPPVAIQVETLPAQDWEESWKAHFKPLQVGRTIVIKPSWEAHLPLPGQHLVEIDPGRAFGTGRHPSTYLCIEALEEVLTGKAKEASVLDVGTGSGILAIVAARLGAPRVVAVDVDPEALEVAAANVVRNRVEGVVQLQPGPLDRLFETFSVVVANLTAEILEELQPALLQRTRPGGSLLASGILAEQAASVRERFRRYFATCRARQRQEWVLLAFLDKKAVP